MKTCIRIPRLFVPRDYEDWILPADGADGGRPQREGVRGVTVHGCIAPHLLRGNGEEEKLAAMRDNMYTALENGELEGLERGFLLVRRKTAFGVRRGILACVDLEELLPGGGGAVRLTAEADPALVNALVRERAQAVLEFPRTVLCYRDKRDKLMRALEEEELAPLYEIDTPQCTLNGEFIYDFIAEELLHDLMRYADPCFGVLDGNHTLLAARLFWEQTKAKLSEREARNHPARFALAEFVNLCDPAVQLTDAGNAPVKKDELLSMLKADKKYPAGGVRLREERISLEGREISYD